MKDIMISIQPKWCELIVLGKKKADVRKSRPDTDVPFKAYIYQTKLKWLYSLLKKAKLFNLSERLRNATGKVIGEFICDSILALKAPDDAQAICNQLHETCVPNKDLIKYAKGKKLYYWHISNLVIYAEPKPLSNFIIPSKVGCCNEGKCRGCEYLDKGNGFNVEDDYNARFNTDEYKPLRKAPQSWCYVEEPRSPMGGIYADTKDT